MSICIGEGLCMKRMKFIITLFVVALVVISYSSVGVAATFKDVSTRDIAYPAIEEMAKKGIVTGYSDGTFRQNAPVTRAQAATFIGRALGIKSTSNKHVSFKDLPTNSGAYVYVAELVNRGVFANGEYFYPHRTLTREEMAKILVLAFRLEGTTNQTFSDVPKHSWAAPYIQKLTASGVTSGVGNNQFDPRGQVTRGQMAMFISRALQGGQKEGQVTNPPVKESQASAVEKEIFTLINEERKKAGLKPLTWAEDLAAVARLKSADMLKYNYFDHQSPTYGSPFQMMSNSGIEYLFASENIAYGYGGSAEAVVKGWMNSASHKKNILSREVGETGIGVAQGKGKNDFYFTQMFINRK